MSNAEEYAKKERIKMLVELFIDGTLSVEAATKKLGFTESTDETFSGYAEEYNEELV